MKEYFIHENSLPMAYHKALMALNYDEEISDYDTYYINGVKL